MVVWFGLVWFGNSPLSPHTGTLMYLLPVYPSILPSPGRTDKIYPTRAVQIVRKACNVKGSLWWLGDRLAGEGHPFADEIP